MAKHIDMTGKKFGRLTVLKEAGHPKPGTYLWECVCDCAEHNHIIVDGNRLRSGNTKSCGCIHREGLVKRNKENAVYTITNERVFRIWEGMKDRCYNPNNTYFKNYGGRGIKICGEWKNSYETFESWALSNGYSDGLTIERKDFNIGYCPENCCWADWTTQANNKSNNKFLTYKGETKTLAQWCRELNLDYFRTKARLNTCKWTVEEAFESEKYEQVKLNKQNNPLDKS